MLTLHAKKKSVSSFPPHNQITTDEAEQLLGQEEDRGRDPQERGKDPPPHVNSSIIANYHRFECFGL